MKKILLPALAAFMIAAAPAAFAQGGPWYVIKDLRSTACYAAHHIGVGGEQQTLSGPLASQSAAISAIGHINGC